MPGCVQTFTGRAMAKKSLNPYLDQTLSVLNRAAGVAPSRIRAVGFLRQKLRKGLAVGSAAGAFGPRPRVPTVITSRQGDRG
jgi:hypothetical protein